jgi:hypothetical protein
VGLPNDWSLYGLRIFWGVVAGISDYVENMFIQRILSSYPLMTEKMASKATLTKTISGPIVLSLFFIGMIAYLFLKNKLKKEKEKTV